jgi:glycosyltransferase involved in cell wall biosynthesis
MKPRSHAIRSVHKVLLPRYDAFLVIGEANYKFYADSGIQKSKLFSCPYFVDNDRLRRQARFHRNDRDAIRSRWKIPEDCVCYLYVGKLTQKKHVLDQLAALKVAYSRNSKLHLLVVGTGDLMELAVQFSAIHNLPVTFAGFLNQSEITAAYVAADCLILSSDYDETWGLVVNEAMVCGLPAIVSDRVGCGPDLIKSGKTGERFAFGDTDALSDLMLSMAENRDRLASMGEKAKALVLDQYTVEKTVSGTMQAVDAVFR